jgi:putative PIN family toxin of toxin-antitoxin system
MRVVLDTNIVLSALIFNGKTAVLRQKWQANLFMPLVSKATITELIKVLTYPKFKLTREEQEELLSDYLPFCETVTIPEKLPPIPTCRDTFDQPFLVLAKVAAADFLVTGDLDLLALKDDFSCPILTVNDFIGIIPPKIA